MFLQPFCHVLFYFYVIDVCDVVAPSVHDDGWAVCGEYDLYVWVEVCEDVEQALLPFYVEADFWFVHEEDAGAFVLYEYSEQYDEHLFFYAGEVVGWYCLAVAVEEYLVAVSFDGFSCFAEEFVYDVLEVCFFFCQLLYFFCGVGVLACEEFHHSV